MPSFIKIGQETVTWWIPKHRYQTNHRIWVPFPSEFFTMLLAAAEVDRQAIEVWSAHKICLSGIPQQRLELRFSLLSHQKNSGNWELRPPSCEWSSKFSVNSGNLRACEEIHRPFPSTLLLGDRAGMWTNSTSRSIIFSIRPPVVAMFLFDHLLWCCFLTDLNFLILPPLFETLPCSCFLIDFDETWHDCYLYDRFNLISHSCKSSNQ